MSDRRDAIVAAGVAVLRESGFAGFTQPRVAARAGLRQSNLTYYFPTRADLLAAVARAAIDRQLAAMDAIADGRSIEAASAVIATVAVRHENTRVLMALAQAAEQEPRVRELFRELADGIVLRAGRLLEGLGLPSTAETRFLVHALSVGLAVVDLAVDWPGGERRAASVLETTFTLLTKGSGQ